MPGHGLTPASWHYARYFDYGAIENRNNRPSLAQSTLEVIDESAALQGLGTSLECTTFGRLEVRMYISITSCNRDVRPVSCLGH